VEYPFFKSDNLESIQLCTIHSTKGLAYPMIILANSDKNVYSQIQSDSIKSNSFTLKNGDKKLITGFKVDYG
jgi:ATP-dependent exoDNAse (exonuclease V) beta subunit